VFELLTDLTEKDVNICLTVLAAAGIFCQTSRQLNRWTLSVNDEDREKALFEIESYYRENNRLIRDTPEDSLPPLDFSSGILAALVILAFHISIIRYTGMEFFLNTFGASASSIRHGELYRIVTALFLHSSAMHLFGNMTGLVFLVPVVCRIQGFGAGLLSILISGAFGNYINAHFYQKDHLSIGASTAVFGAVGILVAYRFVIALRSPRQRFKIWMPIGSGLCLLGLFSAGEHTDILAHLFGFSCGMASGYLFHRILKEPPRPFYQYLAFSAVLSIILLSWIRAW